MEYIVKLYKLIYIMTLINNNLFLSEYKVGSVPLVF